MFLGRTFESSFHVCSTAKNHIWSKLGLTDSKSDPLTKKDLFKRLQVLFMVLSCGYKRTRIEVNKPTLKYVSLEAYARLNLNAQFAI